MPHKSGYKNRTATKKKSPKGRKKAGPARPEGLSSQTISFERSIEKAIEEIEKQFTKDILKKKFQGGGRISGGVKSAKKRKKK